EPADREVHEVDEGGEGRNADLGRSDPGGFLRPAAQEAAEDRRCRRPGPRRGRRPGDPWSECRLMAWAGDAGHGIVLSGCIDGGEGGRHRAIPNRRRKKRTTVARAFVALRTTSARRRPARGATTPTRAVAALVIDRATAKAMSPARWWRPSDSDPRTPNVRRRFAAVLPTAVARSATTLASAAAMPVRRSA